jgi:DNA-binding PadR family transcriptional regulator
MPAISDADTALLGLLSEEPKHPWQIDKDVQWRDMRFWTDLSQSTIYKQLRTLAAAGLVSAREEPAEGRLRKVYSLTEAGRVALRERLLQLLSEPQHLKWRVDLGTYNLDLLPRREAIEALARYRARLAESVAGYRELEKFLVESGCPAHRLAVARRPVHMLEGEMAWLDEFAAELRADRSKQAADA